MEGLATGVRTRSKLGAAWVLAGLLGLAAEPAARAQNLETRQDLRRSLAEYLFLSGQLGFRQRTVAYADDAVQGPGGRSELRFHLNGRYASAPSGGFGAYVGLGVVGRVPSSIEGDPLRSPYDEFAAQQNLRIFGAHVQYVLDDEDGRSFLSVRAGRLADFDDRARLLSYDGALVELNVTPMISLGVYGGRRAALDGNFADDRTDVAAQLVTGVYALGRFDTLTVRLAHRFEEVQEAGLKVSWDPMAQLGLQLSGQAVFGGRDAVDADVALTGAGDAGPPVAVVLRFDGDFSSTSGQTGLYLLSEVQVGTDPRVYGRGGKGFAQPDVDAALRSSLDQARLDRLFLGPRQPHVFAELGFEHWLTPVFGVRAGGYARLPLGDSALRSLQPRTIEAWAGPELATGRGDRVALELRLATEDPGDAERVFVAAGDGERLFGALRAYGEVPILLSEGWAVALRPEVEATVWSTRGPLVEAKNQQSFYGGLLASLKAGPHFRTAVRYGLGTQPDFSADGVQLIHDLELWVGGAF